MKAADLFKDLVWDNLVKAALGKLTAAVPLLGWGPIGWVVKWVVLRFTEKLFEALHLAVDLKLIAIRNEAHMNAYTRASVKLKLIARDHGIESEEFKKARDESTEALYQFVQFNR